MTDGLIGLELLLRCAKPDIQKKEDVLVLLVHHSLLKAGFKCAGIGEEWNSEDTALSELLPNGWNVSNKYTLRYKRGDEKYVLSSIRSDDVIVFNLTCPEKMKITNIIFNVNESVATIDCDISVMVHSREKVIRDIEQQMIVPFSTIQKADMNTQTDEDPPPKVRMLSMPTPHPLLHRNNDFDLPDLTSVGRRDLDPLAAMGGGGMVFDPLRENRNRLIGDIGLPQRLPRGAVPPNARFDPFGPPDNDIRGRLPPGYDMFG